MNTYTTDDKFIRLCRHYGIRPNQSDYEYYLSELASNEDDTDAKDFNPDS